MGVLNKRRFFLFSSNWARNMVLSWGLECAADWRALPRVVLTRRQKIRLPDSDLVYTANTKVESGTLSLTKCLQMSNS